LYNFSMCFPINLRQAIENELSQFEPATLVRASAQVTQRYKTGDYSRAPLDSSAARLAYARVRMPATFAANARVFAEIARHIASVDIRSVLDLGAGPGTSMWAAADTFPSIERFTLIERDHELADLGRRLAWHSSNDAIRSARWEQRDLNSAPDLEPHDLVVLSYLLGELSPQSFDSILRAAWMKARHLLAIIEPGTPRNFARLISARSLLLDSGAHPLAPCPHSAQCPMALAGDWCHFAARLQRTAEHRHAKAASLGYEDEKFSYFVAAKTPLNLPPARIVRHPMKHKGHVILTLCAPAGLQSQTVAKSQKIAYKSARNAQWGDSWEQFAP
jgi:ribosomal protein RSM22 (predicted rRNA methylase)